MSALKRGVDLYLDRRYEAALDALPDESAAKTTLISDYVLYYRAKSNFMLERHKEALRDFRRLETQYPDSPLLRQALAEQCQTLLALNEAKTALALLGNPKIGTSAETLFYQARALDLAGEKQRSAEIYLQIYSRYPGSKYAQDAQKYIISSSKTALKGTRNFDARLQRAEILIRNGDYKQAGVLLTALGKVKAPDTQSAAKRNLLRGELLYRQGKNAAAIPYFQKVTAASPALHPKALYLEGSCLRRLEKEQAFIAQRDRLLKLYPRSPEAEELCYSAATYFDVNYEPANSRSAYGMLYEAFPKGKYAERALWKLSLFSYFAKNYGEAALGFWKYLAAYPDIDSAGQALYWMGRCYEKLGDPVDAKYLYGRARALANESYYGQIAREAEAAVKTTGITRQVSVSGIDFSQIVSFCDGLRLGSTQWMESGSPAAQVIGRARELMAAGLEDHALSELRSGRTRFPKDAAAFGYAMSRIYAARNDNWEAIASLRNAFPDYIYRPLVSLPSEIWDVLYPMHHSDIVSEQASRAEIDPALVLGLIRQESAFEQMARSKANARGLMQLLPSTGRLLARQAGIRRFTPAKLYQPETNITLGVRFFGSLLQHYRKPELALAAYNAGKSRVDRWLEEYGDLEMVEFVEQIPFSETRGYVKQVLSNKVRYNLLTSSARQ